MNERTGVIGLCFLLTAALAHLSVSPCDYAFLSVSALSPFSQPSDLTLEASGDGVAFLTFLELAAGPLTYSDSDSLCSCLYTFSSCYSLGNLICLQ